MKIKDFKELNVWQTGIEIVEQVYRLTRKFPKDERFGLTHQIQRSAVSIPSNVAEGFNRQYPKEFIQFCHVSLGSCAELETHLIIAARLKYITDKDLKNLTTKIHYECKMLRNLVTSLKSKSHHTSH